jgi:hypothetical protein
MSVYDVSSSGLRWVHITIVVFYAYVFFVGLVFASKEKRKSGQVLASYALLLASALVVTTGTTMLGIGIHKRHECVVQLESGQASVVEGTISKVRWEYKGDDALKYKSFQIGDRQFVDQWSSPECGVAKRFTDTHVPPEGTLVRAHVSGETVLRLERLPSVQSSSPNQSFNPTTTPPLRSGAVAG